MRRKKSIPLPDPENAGFEYSCPTAAWDGMTRIIPIGESDDKVDEARKEILPHRTEYFGENTKQP
ncbi:MAG: hypothetical protein IKP78_03420 [Ruminococcus sp.]|nr:hypothetical protein [Ruminococcus sp.]